VVVVAAELLVHHWPEVDQTTRPFSESA
jgi:hypothetical protein